MTSRRRWLGARVSRRRALATLTGVTIGVSGCTSTDPDDGTDDGSGDDSDDDFLSDYDPFDDDDSDDSDDGDDGEDDDSEGNDENDVPVWEREANERILEYRTSELEIAVLRDDEPVTDADVTVTMQTHDYGFGTAVNVPHFQEETDEGDPYHEKLTELFNTAVLENYHKWGPWEDPENRDQADETVEWLLEREFDVRGHTCIWQTEDFGFYQYPDDVLEALEDEDVEYLRDRSIEHVETIVSAYEGELIDWDVVNEQLDHHGLTDVVNPDDPVTEKPILVDWYEAARAGDPDAKLYLNEFNVVNGYDPGKVSRYVALAEFLLGEGVDVGGFGMQAHHFGGLHQRPAGILDVCDTLAATGDVELAVTEYDTPGANEDEAAEYLHRFLKTIFSHPATERFLVWGFWDGTHWADDAPFFREDWSEKPALAVYADLVFGEWWTDEAGTTDDGGQFSVRAFLGVHEITVRTDEDEVTETVSLTDPGEPVTVEVDLSS